MILFMNYGVSITKKPSSEANVPDFKAYFCSGVHRARNPDLTFLGVFKDSLSDVFIGERLLDPPTLFHNLWAAGVNWPEDIRGLLGNLGIGVESTLPVKPLVVDARLVLACLSTKR